MFNKVTYGFGKFPFGFICKTVPKLYVFKHTSWNFSIFNNWKGVKERYFRHIFLGFFIRYPASSKYVTKRLIVTYFNPNIPTIISEKCNPATPPSGANVFPVKIGNATYYIRKDVEDFFGKCPHAKISAAYCRGFEGLTNEDNIKLRCSYCKSPPNCKNIIIHRIGCKKNA